MKRVHLMIHGDVHGVSFRYYTRKKAQELELVGFVRNVPEGIEIVAQGEDRNVGILIDFCKRGPSSARVEDVEIVEEKPKDDFKNFEVRF